MINKLDLSSKADLLRKRLGEDNSSPIDVFNLVQSIEDLTLVFYPLSKNISGVCCKGDRSSLIAINSDMSMGRQRFSLAHELYHLFYEDSYKTTVSKLNIGDVDSDSERNANQFASYFLMPSTYIYDFKERLKSSGQYKLTIDDVIRLEQYFGLSHKAMLYRLIDEKMLSVEEAKSMEAGVIELAARLGYDTELYYPSPENRKMLVLGSYVSKADKLLERDLISQGKYEDLLLSAFRDDIVYGVSSGEISID